LRTIRSRQSIEKDEDEDDDDNDNDDDDDDQQSLCREGWKKAAIPLNPMFAQHILFSLHSSNFTCYLMLPPSLL